MHETNVELLTAIFEDAQYKVVIVTKFDINYDPTRQTTRLSVPDQNGHWIHFYFNAKDRLTSMESDPH